MHDRYGKDTIPEKHIIFIDGKIINKIAQFIAPMKEWKKKEANNKNWANLKTHFMEAHK